MSIYSNASANPLIVSFTSRSRIAGTNSDFYSSPINLINNRYTQVCLLQASIPRSFFNVPLGANTFILIEGINSTTITVPAASYNVYNLATTLSDIMTTNSSSGFIYTVSYAAPCEPDTFRYTFTVTGNGGVQPQLIFNDQESMNRQLGFDNDTIVSFVGDTLMSTNSVNLSYITRAFIKSDVVSNTLNSVLEEILNYGDFPMKSLCFFQQFSIDLNARTLNSNGANSFRFSLVDSFDRLIDLNNIPWSFSLVFFERQDLQEIQKQESQIMNELRLLELNTKSKNIIAELDKETGRLMKVNDVPPGERSSLATTPSQVPELTQQQSVGEMRPIFPTLPFGSSNIVEQMPLANEEF